MSNSPIANTLDSGKPSSYATNLDSFMHPEDLQAHINEVRCRGNYSIRYMFYAVNKHRAMQERINGNIQQALAYEQKCDGIYSAIPRAWRRW